MSAVDRRSNIGRSMLIALAVSAAALTAVSTAAGAVQPFSAKFTATQMSVSGDATQYVRTGGTGPAVLLLHGFGDTGDMWQPLAELLVRDHLVIVPDLRGMGLSSHPEGGYEKTSQARDLAAILDQLGVQQITLVTHDIGNMVGYALAAQFPQRVSRWIVMDAPVPGLGNWEKQLVNPLVWHFNFRGPDVERLVAGRERILLDRFYNELSAHPAGIDEPTRQHYAELYAKPRAIHDAFSGQFAAFTRDAEENKTLFAKNGKLPMPVLAIGGDHSYGAAMKTELETMASDVQGAVITDSGHWIMEEQPQQAIDIITNYIAADPKKRLTRSEVDAVKTEVAGAGTSGLPAVTTRVLFGDPKAAGLYTIELHVAPNTTIEAHTHRDMRTAVVLEGMWYFGYGSKNERSLEKALAPGSFYTEPAGERHFARTGAEGATVEITGYGPTDTVYVAAGGHGGV
jgi:pimeloyl-ACP methyl ester carboxylesterase/quercetin dioxygenase-like cupin family protein